MFQNKLLLSVLSGLLLMVSGELDWNYVKQSAAGYCSLDIPTFPCLSSTLELHGGSGTPQAAVQ